MGTLCSGSTALSPSGAEPGSLCLACRGKDARTISLSQVWHIVGIEGLLLNERRHMMRSQACDFKNKTPGEGKRELALLIRTQSRAPLEGWFPGRGLASCLSVFSDHEVTDVLMGGREHPQAQGNGWALRTLSRRRLQPLLLAPKSHRSR